MQTDLLSDGLEQLDQKLFRRFSPGVQEDERLIQKGLFLYRQGTVYDMGFDVNNQMLKAKVRDVHGVSVRISLDPAKGSSCSCPEESWCRHRMAVFFKFYQQHASVSQWITTWRNQKHDVSRLEKTPESWDRVIDRVWTSGEFDVLSDKPYLAEHYVLAALRKLTDQAPVEKEWVPLYKLYTSFYLFSRLAAFFAEEPHEDINHALSIPVDRIKEAMYDLAVYAHPFSFDPFLKKLREDSSQFLMHSNPLHFTVYGMLWFQLFTKAGQRDQEWQRLKALKETEEVLLAKSLFSLLLKHDSFLASFRKTPDAAVPHAVQWIEWLLWDDQKHQAVEVMKGIQEKLEGYLERLPDHSDRRSFAMWLIYKIEGDKLRMQSPDVTIRLYEKLLPYSGRHLGSLLLDAGKYKEWVELVHWIDFSPEELEMAGFKKLIEQKPEYAVPLLHQWIEVLIVRKQRETYKKAVRYLKKLRSIYKEMGQSARFDIYFDRLMKKYKRLRAFREECERGKLIDANH
ncbi:SWIM zinc finger family protein [Jeotgalibacillus aurantiacus]|uniref:SWIM zinc finger family protein n=1 Tax=Jeotgalibacillus aurantiacus TaxID=2763266 RepID=UPI001D0A2205|nr:SWIM zinc finger family protein [Jeotgalibacillus aurantiacus]